MHADESMGRRMRQAREALEYTQSDISEAIGSKLRSWQAYETGQRMPGSQVMAGLSKLGINANWVLTGQGPMLLEERSPAESLEPRPLGDVVQAQLETIQRNLERQAKLLDLSGPMNGEGWEAYEGLLMLSQSGIASADQRQFAQDLLDRFFIDSGPKSLAEYARALKESGGGGSYKAPPIAPSNPYQRHGVAPAAERPAALTPEFYALLAGPLMAHTGSAQERQVVIGTVLKVLEASTGNDPEILARLQEEQLDKLVELAASLTAIADQVEEERASKAEERRKAVEEGGIADGSDVEDGWF